MEIKILFLDLDGTALNDAKEISSENRKALWDCSDKGITIGYVTSRADRKLKEILRDVPCDFICSLNGAHIQILERGKLLWEEYDGFSWQQGIDMLKKCQSLPKTPIGAYFLPYSIWGEEIFYNGIKLGKVCDCLSSVSPVRFQRIRFYHVEDAALYSWDLKNVNLYKENEDIVIESSYVDKGTAVKKILNYYGFSSEYAVAFGDSKSDALMFRECRFGIAMQNATEELMLVSTEVTEDCNHSGVAKWIRENICPELPEHIISSLGEENGIFLLKDLREMKKPVSFTEKRSMLQKGVPGQCILALDPPIDEKKEILFQKLTDKNRYKIAEYVGILSESILKKKSEFPILVSLARGGIIYGAACKKYYKKYYHVDIPHYVVSFVRGLGIDENALNYIVRQHGDRRIQFIDGWTGSGYVSRQLKMSIDDYNARHNANVCGDLAVLADTSHICEVSGTREDVMLPDCCLNATVCGLLSGICVDTDCMAPEDFHGAIIFNDLKEHDFSHFYLESLMSATKKQNAKSEKTFQNYGKQMGELFKEKYGVKKVSAVRLGIGETTRAMFRRDVKFILTNDPMDERIDFLSEMAKEKHVPIIQADTGSYISVAILVEGEDD